MLYMYLQLVPRIILRAPKVTKLQRQVLLLVLGLTKCREKGMHFCQFCLPLKEETLTKPFLHPFSRDINLKMKCVYSPWSTFVYFRVVSKPLNPFKPIHSY